MTPTIICCAVTGSHSTREHNENLPVTPAEIAGACIGAARAGAAICHIHVRDPHSGRPSITFGEWWLSSPDNSRTMRSR
jgi:uncharacterized protein (DUF849 family)